MSKDMRFWDRMAEKYARQPIKDEDAYQIKLARTRDCFTPESEVLEFGCGTGSTAIVHAPHVRHILATDISEEMLRIAQEKTDQAGIENITYQRAGFEELDLASGQFDAVLALSILHLLDDWHTAVRRVFETVKPGGVFVSSTVVLKGRMPLFRLVYPLGKLTGLFPLLRFFDADELEASLVDAGFEIEHRWQKEKSLAVFFIARKPL